MERLPGSSDDVTNLLSLAANLPPNASASSGDGHQQHQQQQEAPGGCGTTGQQQPAGMAVATLAVAADNASHRVAEAVAYQVVQTPAGGAHPEVIDIPLDGPLDKAIVFEILAQGKNKAVF